MSRHPDRTRPPTRAARREVHASHRRALKRERLARGVPRYSRHQMRPGAVVLVRHAGHHPAVVVAADDHGITVRPATSNPRDGWIVDWIYGWDEAGLTKPTAVQRRTVTIPREDVLHQFGALNEPDRLRILQPL